MEQRRKRGSYDACSDSRTKQLVDVALLAHRFVVRADARGAPSGALVSDLSEAVSERVTLIAQGGNHVEKFIVRRARELSQKKQNQKR